MTDELKNKEAEAFEAIKASKRVLLHLHIKPDPDSIGCALAMYHALRSLGKDVTVIKGDSLLSPIFSFMPGYGEIALKNYFEIDISEYDLFIIQDTATKQLISREGEIVFPPALKTVIVDHHKTNELFADINLVDVSHPAAAEYLYDLFTGWGIEITEEMAICLYIGIYGDTGGFRYLTTTPHTMEVVARLAKIYPGFPKLVYQLEYNNPKEKVLFDGLALSSIEVFFDGRVALASIPFNEMEARGIKREDSDNNVIAGTLITVKEWQLGVTLIEKAPNEISVSFRSKGDIDVAKIAAVIGGGGHKPAAGAMLKKPLAEAKDDVLKAISSVVTF